MKKDCWVVQVGRGLYLDRNLKGNGFEEAIIFNSVAEAMEALNQSIYQTFKVKYCKLELVGE